MKNIILISIIAILTLFACEKNPNEAPFNHNSSLAGFVNFEQATRDSIIADVKLFFQGETILIAETQTDTSGFYDFHNLASGIYQINISAPNYAEYSLSDISLLSNQTTILDTIILEILLPIEIEEINVDGIIDDGWEAAYSNDHESNWSTSNDFAHLYIARDDDSLYIAVDGGFDAGGNAVNIYIDKDYGDDTGINNFSTIQGGGFGDHLRKTVNAPETFGADLAFSEWALSSEIGIVSLEEPQAVDQHLLENVHISLNASVIEFAIPFTALYENGEIPFGKKIALVAIIGGGGDQYFADDTIPQQTDFSGTFMTVFSRAY